MSVQQGLNEKIERLKKISLLKDVIDNQKAMMDIAKLLKTVHFSLEEDVIKEKEAHGDSLFIIKSGTVEIIKKTMQGDPYTFATLSADMNIFFGEMALLDPDERSATVRCKTDCEFYVLDRDKFIDFGNKNPMIGLIITRELSRILCQRFRKSNNDMVILFDALVEEVEKSGGLQ